MRLGADSAGDYSVLLHTDEYRSRHIVALPTLRLRAGAPRCGMAE